MSMIQLEGETPTTEVGGPIYVDWGKRWDGLLQVLGQVKRRRGCPRRSRAPHPRAKELRKATTPTLDAREVCGMSSRFPSEDPPPK